MSRTCGWKRGKKLPRNSPILHGRARMAYSINDLRDAEKEMLAHSWKVSVIYSRLFLLKFEAHLRPFAIFLLSYHLLSHDSLIATLADHGTLQVCGAKVGCASFKPALSCYPVVPWVFPIPSICAWYTEVFRSP